MAGPAGSTSSSVLSGIVILAGVLALSPAHTSAQSHGSTPAWPSSPGVPAAPGQALDDQQAAHLYAEARGDFDANRVGEGQRKLEILVARFPGSPLADVARRDLARLYGRALSERDTETGSQARPGTLRELATDAPSKTRRNEPHSTSLVAMASEDFRSNSGDRVFFAEGAHDLGTRARGALEAQAQWLRRYPMIEVKIEGHADERGTADLNRQLSLRRAEAVKARLVELGIPAERISIEGHGRDRPLAFCRDDLCAAQNRVAITAIIRANGAGSAAPTR